MPGAVNVARLYSLLKRTEPVSGEYDVVWHGPYYVPRSRQWHPSHFMLYGGKLFCTLQMDWKHTSMVWDIAKGRSVEDPSVSGPVEDDIWRKAVPELERKLHSALANPRRYNKRVARWLPLQCRNGRVERRLTWPEGVIPMPKRHLVELGEGLVSASRRPERRATGCSRPNPVAAHSGDPAHNQGRAGISAPCRENRQPRRIRELISKGVT